MDPQDNRWRKRNEIPEPWPQLSGLPGLVLGWKAQTWNRPKAEMRVHRATCQQPTRTTGRLPLLLSLYLCVSSIPMSQWLSEANSVNVLLERCTAIRIWPSKVSTSKCWQGPSRENCLASTNRNFVLEALLIRLYPTGWATRPQMLSSPGGNNAYYSMIISFRKCSGKPDQDRGCRLACFTFYSLRQKIVSLWEPLYF